MNNKQKYILIAIIIGIVISILSIVVIARQEKPDDTQNGIQSTENQTAPDSSEETDPNQVPEETNETQNNTSNILSFPYAIPGSDLVIEQVNSYDGLFFEDGSDREVSNVTAIVLANKGNSCMEYVNITMKCGDTRLRFVGSTLDAGAKMIILEADAKTFQNGAYSDCAAEISSMDKLVMSSAQIYVEENGKGGLLVTNLTKEDIPCVRIFYKYYMDDVEVYVGGITYTAKLVELKAGKSIVVTPSHYYAGFSKVLMVKTYDTKD